MTNIEYCMFYQPQAKGYLGQKLFCCTVLGGCEAVRNKDKISACIQLEQVKVKEPGTSIVALGILVSVRPSL